MPFPSGLTSQQKIDIRANNYTRKAYVLRTPKNIIFQATVQDAVNGLDYASIDYDTPTIGAYTDIVSGMTIMVHTDSADIDDVLFPPTYARGLSTADVVNIGWQATNLAGTDTITVLDDYRLHVRQVRADADVIYIDYDRTFTKLLPLVRGLQSVYAVNSSSASSIAFAPTVEAMASGAAISTYLWDVGDGTITVGSSASKDVTVEFPAWTSGETSGWRWVSLTATDDNSNFSTIHFQVFVGDFSSATWVMDDTFGFDTGSVIDNGFVTSLTVGGESPPLLYDNNHITIVIDENKNGDTDPIVSNILFVGRVTGLVDSVTASLIQENYQIILSYSTSYEVQGYGNELESTPLPEYQLLNAETPTQWNDVKDLSISRAIWYVLTNLTTAPLFMSFDLDTTTYNGYENSGFGFENGAILASINQVALLVGCKMMFARSGECKMVKDARLLADVDRGGLDTVLELINDDLITQINITIPEKPRIGRILSTGALYNTSADDTALAQVQAPKIPNTVGESVRNAEFLTLSNQDTDDFEVELATITANTLALKNNTVKVSASILDGYWWLSAYNGAWDTLTFNDLQSGLSFDSSTRFILNDVSLSVQNTFDNVTGIISQVWQNAVTLTQETSDEGVANSFKLAPRIMPYTIPSNPLIAPYGSDYDPENSFEDSDTASGFSSQTGSSSPSPVQPPDANPHPTRNSDSITVPLTGASVSMNKTTIASNVYKVTVTGSGFIGYQEVENITLDWSIRDAFVYGTTSLNPSVPYTGVVSGTGNLGGVFDPQDAEYREYDTTPVPETRFVSTGAVFSLIDPAFQPTHVYDYTVSSSGGVIGVQIFDDDYDGNTGELVFSVSENTQADAFYSFDSTGATALGGIVGLEVNNTNVPAVSVSPGSYNAGGRYTFYMTGTGIQEVFSFADTDFTDNSGELSVTIEGEFA